MVHDEDPSRDRVHLQMPIDARIKASIRNICEVLQSALR